MIKNGHHESFKFLICLYLIAIYHKILKRCPVEEDSEDLKECNHFGINTAFGAVSSLASFGLQNAGGAITGKLGSIGGSFVNNLLSTGVNETLGLAQMGMSSMVNGSNFMDDLSKKYTAGYGIMQAANLGLSAATAAMTAGMMKGVDAGSIASNYQGGVWAKSTIRSGMESMAGFGSGMIGRMVGFGAAALGAVADQAIAGNGYSAQDAFYKAAQMGGYTNYDTWFGITKEFAGAAGNYGRGMTTHNSIMGLMERDYRGNPNSTSINSAVLAMNDFGDAQMRSRLSELYSGERSLAFGNINGAGLTVNSTTYINNRLLGGSMDDIMSLAVVMGHEAYRDGTQSYTNDADYNKYLNTVEGVNAVYGHTKFAKSLNGIYGQDFFTGTTIGDDLAALDQGGNALLARAVTEYSHEKDSWLIKEVDGKMMMINDKRKDIYIQGKDWKRYLIKSHNPSLFKKIKNMEKEIKSIEEKISESKDNETLKNELNVKLSEISEMYKSYNNGNVVGTGHREITNVMASFYGVSPDQLSWQTQMKYMKWNKDTETASIGKWKSGASTKWKWVNGNKTLDESFEMDITSQLLGMNGVKGRILGNKNFLSDEMFESLHSRKDIERAISDYVLGYARGDRDGYLYTENSDGTLVKNGVNSNKIINETYQELKNRWGITDNEKREYQNRLNHYISGILDAGNNDSLINKEIDFVRNWKTFDNDLSYEKNGQKYVKVNDVEYPVINGASYNIPQSGDGYETYRYSAPWGTKRMIETLINFSEEWKKTHPKDPIFIGNLSDVGGRYAHKWEKTPGEWKEVHKEGTSVDLYYMIDNNNETNEKRIEMSRGGFQNNNNYNKKKTIEFIKTFLEYKGTAKIKAIYFNDEDVYEQFPGIAKYETGHYDHIHITFY